MKLVIEREILAVALSRVTPLISRSTIPILSNIKLSASGSTLTVLANNLQQAATQTASAVIGEPGEACVQADKFAALVNSLPKGSQLEIEAVDRKLTVRYGRAGRASFVTLDPRDYPTMPALAESEPFTIGTSEFHRLLAMTLPTASNELTRPYLCGVCLHGDHRALTAVSTDGVGLAVGETLADCGTIPSIIVPREACTALVRILASAAGDVAIRVTATGINMEIGSCSFQTKLIDETFPDYRRVIPDRVKTPILIAAAALAAIARRAQAVTEAADATKARPRSIRLRAERTTLRLEAGSKADQLLQEEIEIPQIPEKVEINVGTEYVLDAIAALGGDGPMELHITGPSHPMLMRRVGGDAELVVIMGRRS